MEVIRRHIKSGEVDGKKYIGAVDCGDLQFAGLSVGGRIAETVLRLPPVTIADLPKSEPELFAGKRCLFAIRNGERAEAVEDWLNYHVNKFGAEAALILDRAEDPEPFADALNSLALPAPVVLVSCDQPLGLPDGPDMRDPATAPASRLTDAVTTNPWHAPLRAFATYEILRHQFLSEARSVAALSIADLMLIAPEGTPFERAEQLAGQMLILNGLECYPWRLRAGSPAPHGDHIAVRGDEKRWVSSWCVSPADMPDAALWQPGRILNIPAADTRPATFRRSMGVVYPGAPVAKLVTKSDLYEDSTLVSLMRNAFRREPVRMPNRLSASDQKSGGTTLVTVMKNEGPFILDWIAHNRAIGVTNFLVYTNDCSDETEHLLDLLSDAGVTRRDNPYSKAGGVPQQAAFRAANSEPLVQNARWLLTLDVDEYLNIHVGDGTLHDLIAAVPEADAISIPWRLFGNGGVHEFSDTPVVEQFSKCAALYSPKPLHAWAFKTLYRNNGLFQRLGIHRPKGLDFSKAQGAVWVNGSGDPMPPNIWRRMWRMKTSTWGYDLAQINHYAVRSAESFLVKRDRGRVNHTKREQGTNYWFRMNHNLEKDQSIRRLDQRVQAEKAALMALPGVKEIHDRCVMWHREKIKGLLEMAEYKEFYQTITSKRMQNLSRLHGHFGMNVYAAGPEVIPDEIACLEPSDEFFHTV